MGFCLGLGASCFDAGSTLGLPCLLDDSCGGGQQCIEGFCLKPGSSIFDQCGNGELERHDYCFDGQAQLTAPNSPWRASGDLNGDGMMDFVSMGNPDSVDPAKISVGLFAAGGYAAVEVADTPGGTIWGLGVGDVSGDGLDDIVVLLDSPMYQAQINTYVNGGNGGSFTLTETITNSYSWYYPPQVADMDGDGLGDVFAVDSDQPRNVFWWKRLSDGYANAVEFEAGRFDGGPAIVTRIDANNTDDVVYVQKGPAIAIVRGQAGDPPRLGNEIDLPANPTMVVAQDLNGDAAMDLVVAHEDTMQVSLLIGDGIGDFKVLDPIDVPVALAADAADIDGDGELDIVVGGAEGLWVLPGFKHREYGLPLEIGPAMNVNKLWLQDVDGDDAIDVVVYDRVAGSEGRSLVVFGNP